MKTTLETMDLNISLVLKTVLQDYALPLGGDHGVAHWARVLENGLRLAEETGAIVEVVQLFAVLHDSRRLNEVTDPGSRIRQRVHSRFPVPAKGSHTRFNHRTTVADQDQQFRIGEKSNKVINIVNTRCFGNHLQSVAALHEKGSNAIAYR